MATDSKFLRRNGGFGRDTLDATAHLRLNVETKAALERIAEKENCSYGQVARVALSEFIMDYFEEATDA